MNLIFQFDNITLCQLSKKFNPDSTTVSFGKHGWHIMRTIVRFGVEGDKIKDLEVIELGKRRSL